MTTTVNEAAASVIPQDIEAITLPFEFELQVTGGFEGRGVRDSAQLVLLTGAWSVWWSQFALDLAKPEEDAFPGFGRPRVVVKPVSAIPREGAAPEAKLWDLGLAHPSEIAGPGGGMEYRFATTTQSGKRSFSGDFSLVETPPLLEMILRNRRPGPDEGYAFTLASTSNVVKCGAQLFCVGIPWAQWRLPLLKGVHPFDLVVYEVGFNEFDAWIGSADTKGSGWIKIAVGSLLIPLFLGVATPLLKGEINRQVEQHAVQNRINSSLYGTDCYVNGYITLDLSNLNSALEAKLRGNTKEDICMFQTTLRGAGEDPGPIDGIYGDNTKAAEQAFRTKWGLQGIKRVEPQFSSSLIKALRGNTPEH